MNFRSQEKSSPLTYVTTTARHLQELPIEEVLSAHWLISEWNPDLISKWSYYLAPRFVRVQILSKIFEHKADREEPWYGTKYMNSKISEELMMSWENADLNQLFHLPEKNVFIASKFDIKDTVCILKIKILR